MNLTTNSSIKPNSLLALSLLLFLSTLFTQKKVKWCLHRFANDDYSRHNPLKPYLSPILYNDLSALCMLQNLLLKNEGRQRVLYNTQTSQFVFFYLVPWMSHCGSVFNLFSFCYSYLAQRLMNFFLRVFCTSTTDFSISWNCKCVFKKQTERRKIQVIDDTMTKCEKKSHARDCVVTVSRVSFFK